MEISVLCVASEMVTISVFTTGGCGARNNESIQKTEEGLESGPRKHSQKLKEVTEK